MSPFYETPAARSDKYSMPISFNGVTFSGGYEIQPVGPPITIGEPYDGGFYAGKFNINADGSGIPTHYLIVSPKATGEAYIPWSLTNTLYGARSSSDGQFNTNIIMSNSTPIDTPAAWFCGFTCNENGGLGGYTDWYMPSAYELDTIYYFLKPSTTANFNHPVGSNPCAVYPQPINTNYTAGDPAQTTAASFRTTGDQFFITADYSKSFYASSSEITSEWFRTTQFIAGITQAGNKVYLGTPYPASIRAIRRVPV